MREGAKRVRLDQETIVDAVLELARTDPHQKITFKRLGEALAVDATAMYRHFRNKEELTRAALDRLIGMAVPSTTGTAGTDVSGANDGGADMGGADAGGADPACEAGGAAREGWRERIEGHLIRLAELALEYPAIGVEGAVTDPAGPGDVAATELLLEALAESGLSGSSLVNAYAALTGFALSYTSAMANEVLMRRDGARDGSTPWISTFGPVNLSRFPHVQQYQQDLLAIDGFAVYRAGLDAILGSIERENGASEARMSEESKSAAGAAQ